MIKIICFNRLVESIATPDQSACPSLPILPFWPPFGRFLTCPYRKFGKHIQKRQLDIPEYAASFVDYKALKKV